MSWIQKLYDTYCYCDSLVGKVQNGESIPLLPVCHTTQMAHLEVYLRRDGSFYQAFPILDETERSTVIPCTEKSQTRSGIHPKNHPLFDELRYLAKDYDDFSAEGDKCISFHNDYMEDLRMWCSSPYAHPKVCTILSYLERGTLVSDLVHAGMLITDSTGKLVEKWDKEKYGDKQGIYQVNTLIKKTFVRFDVLTDDATPLWKDSNLWECFSNYYISYYLPHQRSNRKTLDGDSADETIVTNDLCYVTGKLVPCSEKSPSKIRCSADKAKIISSNDNSGFTYRGRFTEANQAARIGYEVTQKAHNALKWLIAQQGYRNGDQVYVAWATRNEPIPPLGADTVALAETSVQTFEDEDDDFDFETELVCEVSPDVETLYAQKLAKTMAGYRQKLNERSEVVIMGLDSTNDKLQGRLSITYYQELQGSDFLDRLMSWYKSCKWRLPYKKSGKEKYLHIVGTPSPRDIVLAAYGEKAPDKLVKSAIQRIMPCILDGMRFPRDMMRSLAERASNPNAMEYQEYQKVLAIACSVIRKYYIDHNKGELSLAVDYENHQRSYLFGRLLAYYHSLEQWALREDSSSNYRPTNAMRLKYQFSRKPLKTMCVLDQKLQPYLAKLGAKAEKRIREMNAVCALLDGNESEGMLNAPLDETFLIGFSSQMTEFYQNAQNKDGGQQLDTAEQKGE